jgi:hypothetical protein
LSALHQLNAAGYAFAFVVGIVGIICWRRSFFTGGITRWNWRKLRRRFGRAFPLGFLILALMAILGGLLYAPSNYDALAYRVPRVLHWLAAGQWHWIHTDFQRVNTRACGFEWLSAPLIVFTKTDRFLFLINAASFLLLPGLIFSLFVRVGVRGRVAWHWMWLLPSGYCYLLQAGSIANDMFSTAFALAAVDFALRARKSGRVSEACLSLLSAALLIGAKTSNLPLLLPWVVAFLPTWRLWLARPLAFAAIVPPAAGASFLPMAILNIVNCGDWTGMAAERVPIGAGPVWLHLFHNSIMYILENIVPPVFPFVSTWNRIAEALTPTPLALLTQRYFEPFTARWGLGEMQIEEVAGLGFGITILTGLSLVSVVRRWKQLGKPLPEGLFLRLIWISPWISLLYLMAKLNMSGAARFLAPYYPLLMMGLLVSDAHSVLVRKLWWRCWAFLTYGMAALLLVLSPARPLWPVGRTFKHFEARLQGSKAGQRAFDVYGIQGHRPQAFAPLLALLPDDASVLGYSANDFPEASLWKPFGSRRILHVKLDDSSEKVRQRGIKYVLVVLDDREESWPQWVQQMDARELRKVELRLRGGHEPYVWELIELNPPGNGQGAPSPDHQK